jgi:hypothetical protein
VVIKFADAALAEAAAVYKIEVQKQERGKHIHEHYIYR